MTLHTIVKLALLVVVIWFWTVNIVKMLRGHRVPWGNLGVGSVALVGFIYMQGWLE